MGESTPAGEERAGEERTERDGGIDVRRLLAVARLTPAQALTIAADALTDWEARRAADARERAFHPGAVHVAADGRAYMTGRKPPLDGTTSAGDLAAVAALLEDLRAVTWPSPRDPDGVVALDRAIAEARRPQGHAAIVVGILRTADAQWGAEARAELARLVAAASGLPAARAPRPQPAAPRPPEHSRARSRVIARAVAARTWGWALAFLVMIAFIAIEVTFLRHDISRDIRAVLDAGRSGSPASSSASSTASSSASAAPALPPVVRLAPAAAGTVASVDLRPVDRCRPGAVCTLRVQVLLQGQARPQVVTWGFQVLDRCTGTVARVSGGTLRLPSHTNRADVVNTVSLPQGHALAVLALTSQPFVAASEPVYVPANGVCGR